MQQPTHAAPPPMSPVKSSNVESVGYDQPTQTMYVKFRAEPQPYVYEAVPSEVHAAMLKSSSIGSYIHTHVKSAYKGHKLPRT